MRHLALRLFARLLYLLLLSLWIGTLLSKTIFIMQGIPGSGKSTLAKTIADKNNAIIFSTDDYWWKRVDDNVIYAWDASKIGEAHRWNQQRTAKEMMATDGGDIVIDNTNIRRKDAQPYMTLAKIFDYDIVVVRIDVPVEVAIERQIKRPEDRRIPEYVIRRMYETMELLTR